MIRFAIVYAIIHPWNKILDKHYLAAWVLITSLDHFNGMFFTLQSESLGMQLSPNADNNVYLTIWTQNKGNC